MSDTPPSTRGRYEHDEGVLARIGAELIDQLRRIEVRLSAAVCELAQAAWERGELGAPPAGERERDRVARHRAGFLALIGCAVLDRGQRDGDEVVVELDAWEIGAALEAADDLGLLRRSPGS